MILVVKHGLYVFLIIKIIQFAIRLVSLPIIIDMWKSTGLAKGNFKKREINKKTLHVQLWGHKFKRVYFIDDLSTPLDV